MTKSYPKIEDNCTFGELKEWALGFANQIAKSHLDGHSQSSVLVAISVIYETLVGEMLEKTRSIVELITKSDRLSSEDQLRFMSVLSSIENGGNGGDRPTKEELLKIDPALGAALGMLSMMQAEADAFCQVNNLKILTAATMLSDSEKANSLHEIGDCFGFDELSDEQKRDLRNHLKAGTTDPLPIPTENDVDDACDSLFG